MRRVSIVVNNRDYARYVGEALTSALAQTWPATEVIAVDDGSVDGSLDVIAAHPVRVIRLDGRGQGAAFNAGFAAATGDVILFLDADDRLHPEAAASIAALRGFAKVHFPLRVVDALGRPTGAYAPDGRPLPEGSLADRVLRTGVYRSPPTSGNAFAREALERLLPLPEADWPISADSPLFLGAALLGPIAAIPRALGDYRVHGGNRFAGGGIDRLRETVILDGRRQAFVAKLAADLGMSPAGDPMWANPHRCRIRLELLRAEPDRWPLSAVRGRDLALRGLVAAWRGPDQALRQRLRQSLFFLGGGFF